jgi:tetratricopeptide (TPR) repeat protein
MRPLRLLTLLLAAVLLVGCAAAQHIDRAEAAALADRPGDAVRHYQAALRARPRLAQDAEFDAKFRRAQAEAFAAEAARFAADGHWEQAVSNLEQAAGVDLTFPLPDRALTHAKREAAKQVYDRAIEQVNNNHLSDAIATLRLALDYDGDNPAANEALPRLIAQRAERQRQAAAMFLNTQALIDAHHWAAATAQLNQILQLDPEHHDARRALQNAEQQMRQSRQAQQRGEQLLTSKQLDPSIDALEESLTIWPDNREAVDLLRAARHRRQEAADQLAAATAAWRGREYDQALSLALEAESIYPLHPPIQQRLGEIRHDGAAFNNDHGATLIDLGDLAEAETAFRRAIDFLPRHADAMRGLGRVDFAYGERAERDGRPGQALLRYRAAFEHDRQSTYQQRLDAIRGTILAHQRITVAAEALDGNGRPDNVMANKVAALVGHRAPDFIDLAASPDYNAQVIIDHVTVQDNVDSVQHRRHAYTAYRDVRNPRIDDLRYAIDRAEDELHRLERSRHQSCRHCHGRGRIEHLVDGHRGWQSCGHCGGRGHLIVTDEHRIQRARHRLRELERELAHEPALIREAYTAYWNYTVSRYVKTGMLRGRLLVLDREGRTVAEKPIEEHFTAEDSVIAGANPSIGLYEDPLVLPGDADIRSSLLDTAASDAAGATIQIARRVRHDELVAASRHASDPLESQVTAILVLDPDDADARLDALMP